MRPRAAFSAACSDPYRFFFLHDSISDWTDIRKVRDSNPGNPFRGSLVFKASAFVHSANLPESLLLLSFD